MLPYKMLMLMMKKQVNNFEIFFRMIDSCDVEKFLNIDVGILNATAC
jgi:hypothetical protein